MDATVNFVVATVLASTFQENECAYVPTLLWKAKLHQVYWLSWYFPTSVEKNEVPYSFLIIYIDRFPVHSGGTFRFSPLKKYKLSPCPVLCSPNLSLQQFSLL